MHDRYNKLFSTIVTSSIWCAPEATFKIWVGFLAMKDSTGFVSGSIPGMANLCGMSIEKFEEALNVLLEPDPFSRTPDDEGRRLRAVEGGWMVINSDKYDAAIDLEKRREQNRLAQKRWRDKNRSGDNKQNRNPDKQNVKEVSEDKHPQPQPQPDINSEDKDITSSEPNPEPPKPELPPKSEKDEQRLKDAAIVIDRINELMNAKFTMNPNSLTPTLARLKDYPVADLLIVAEHCAALWGWDEAMRAYVRPITLFRANAFPDRLATARAWEARGKPSLRRGAPQDPEAAARDAARRINAGSDEAGQQSGRLQSDGVIRTMIESGRWNPDRPIPAAIYDSLAVEGFDLSYYKREVSDS